MIRDDGGYDLIGFWIGCMMDLSCTTSMGKSPGICVSRTLVIECTVWMGWMGGHYLGRELERNFAFDV